MNYADRAGLEADVALAFPEVIRTMDRVWLEHQSAEIARQRDRGHGNRGGSGQTFKRPR